MRLYKIYYRIVGAVILVAGLVIIPVLPMLVKKDLPPKCESVCAVFDQFC